MRVVELSGGVGGARFARGLRRLGDVDLTVVVNVGDDEINHGLHVSPDLDTVVYTMAGVEGPEGWGRQDDTFEANEELTRFGLDNSFRLGDKDLALNIYRSLRMADGERLSQVTASIASSFDLDAAVLPASDEPVRTEIGIDTGEWIGFQEYFVTRQHRDEVQALRFAGAEEAAPAPGVLEAIDQADSVLIGPSNPPLSIWPILSVAALREVVEAHPDVTAVSPLIGGKALKGPADRVMASLGLPAGNAGVAAAYEGAINRLVVDESDAADVGSIPGIEVVALDTRIADAGAAERLARAIVDR